VSTQEPAQRATPGPTGPAWNEGSETLPGPDAPARRERSPGSLAGAPGSMGRFVVLGVLGHGGMGTVLSAFDPVLDRKVAVKVLHVDLRERHVRRLVREAQALAKLSHPHVVQVYEVGEADGSVFVAMELVHGRTLEAWARRSPPPSWRECVRTYLQAGEGLAAIHTEGLLHRDFKPGNAIVDDEGRVKVLDLGLARQAEDASSEAVAEDAGGADAAAAGPRDDALTRTGVVLGTLAYMPLEQMLGLELDARSDQFSFCVSLYEALYGERPYEGDSMGALVVSLSERHVRPPVPGRAVPRALRRTLLRGLATKPQDRFASMDLLLDELRRQVTPRTRRWLLGGVVVGMGLLGLGLRQYAEVGFRCEGAEAELQGVWDPERRQATGAAILGTSLPYAAETWARVEPALDEYAHAWIARHTEVCEATRVHEQQSEELMDLRMACLASRRLELREAVDVLAQPNATRVTEAVELVAGLPDLDRCDDVEALRAELPPPEDPEVARQVEALREQLARTRSLDRVGEYLQALEIAEATVEPAEALGYAPLVAEALVRRGNLRRRFGRRDEALTDLERAYTTALRNRHEDIARDAVTELVYLVGAEKEQHALGLQWGKTALALARDPAAEADVLMQIGSVLKHQGELDAALEHLRRALAIRERLLGPEHLEVAEALNGVATVLRRTGALEDSLALQQRALAIGERLLGPNHPGVAGSHNNIANVLGAMRRHREAREHFEQALRIREASLGPMHPKLVIVLHNLGEVLSATGEHAKALELLERALHILEANPDSEPPELARELCMLGEVLARQGRAEAAAARYRQAQAQWERVPGVALPERARPWVGLADLALAAGDFTEARVNAERALAVPVITAAPTLLARARFVLAQALWSEPQAHARAVELARFAQLALEEEPDERARVDAWLRTHPAPAG